MGGDASRAFGLGSLAVRHMVFFVRLARSCGRGVFFFGVDKGGSYLPTLPFLDPASTSRFNEHHTPWRDPHQLNELTTFTIRSTGSAAWWLVGIQLVPGRLIVD